MTRTEILLVGSGGMAVEYARVLDALGTSFSVVGRGPRSAAAFRKATGREVFQGGLQAWLKERRARPSTAIVAVGVDQLALVAGALLDAGCRRILVEKPAGLDMREIRKLEAFARRRNAEVFVAYNRRFYASTLLAQRIIREDGGVRSFQFEFTEWAHVVEKSNHPLAVLAHWFLLNSSHVVDLAFFLGGTPKKLAAYTAGGLRWHPKAAVFAGAGVTDRGALFSYSANWKAPGRWGLELCTAKRRLIFRPLEELRVQRLGSLEIENAPLRDELDRKFKPGLYLQTRAFLREGRSAAGLLTLADHARRVEKDMMSILRGSRQSAA